MAFNCVGIRTDCIATSMISAPVLLEALAGPTLADRRILRETPQKQKWVFITHLQHLSYLPGIIYTRQYRYSSFKACTHGHISTGIPGTPACIYRKTKGRWGIGRDEGPWETVYTKCEDLFVVMGEIAGFAWHHRIRQCIFVKMLHI